MDKRIRIARRFAIAMMVVCFLIAGVAASVAAFAIINDGDATVAGLLIGGAGVWIALGFFFYAEQSRMEFESCLEERLNDMVEQLKKCECMCQAEPVSE